MFDFLKTVGQGVLYLILSPFILAGVLLYAVYAVFLFFFMFVKRIVLFFKGENMKTAMRYDAVAEIHINQQDERRKEEAKPQVVQQTTTNNNTTIEHHTTVVQPIIIQTDEEGRLKNVQYVNPAPQVEKQSSVPPVSPDVVEEEKPLLEEVGSSPEDKEEEE